jgi:hypothetical protein
MLPTQILQKEFFFILALFAKFGAKRAPNGSKTSFRNLA